MKKADGFVKSRPLFASGGCFSQNVVIGISRPVMPAQEFFGGGAMGTPACPKASISRWMVRTETSKV